MSNIVVKNFLQLVIFNSEKSQAPDLFAKRTIVMNYFELFIVYR